MSNTSPVLPRAFALVLVLAATAPVPAAGQPATAVSPLLTDVEGDAAIGFADVGAPLPASPALDLLALTLTETPLSFGFTLEVADLAPSGAYTYADSIAWEVTFQAEGRDHRLSIVRAQAIGSADQNLVEGANLKRFDANGTEEWKVELPVRFNLVEARMEVDVPRSLLQSDANTTLAKGSTLGGVVVASLPIARNLFPPFARPTMGDRMPDEGAGSWDLRFGPSVAPQADLRAKQPFRLSNGEATTYLFEATLRTATPGEYTFRMVGAPSTWAVDLPIDRIRVEGAVTVPVVVTVPFFHQHGAWQLARVEASGPDGTVVTDEVGVVFTTVPQPTGHHPTLYLHADGNPDFARGLFMNALDEDPADSRGPVAAETLLCEGSRMAYQWRIPLSPELGLGLQAAARPGRAEMAFTLPADLADVTVRGTVQVEAGEVVVPLAAWEQGAGRLASGDHSVVAEVLPAGSDPIPFHPGSNLVLVLEMQAADAGACVASSAEPMLGDLAASRGPSLMAGGLLTLPLQEYHETIDVSFPGADGLWIKPAQLGTVLVNSGQRLALRAQVGAEAPLDVRLDVRTEGPASATLSTGQVNVGPGSTREVLMTVEVAAAAQTGDRIQVIIVGQASGGQVPAIGQFHLEVDDSVEHASPEAMHEPRESPGLPAWTFLGALALVLALRRRA